MQVDLVTDGGIFLSEPSSIISLLEEEPKVLRTGKGDVTKFG